MDVHEFLEQAKLLIVKNKRRFVRRQGYDYIQELLDLELENTNQAWTEILRLQPRHMFKPPESDYNQPNDQVWFFKKEIKGHHSAYIKLKIEPDRGCICISFHRFIEDHT